jgi:imidazole glycerol phosphate synthase subunit HisF
MPAAIPKAADPVRDAQVLCRAAAKTPAAASSSGRAKPKQRGAGEILLTSMDSDGMRAGFDCELTAAVSEAVSIPVIASGGAGTVAHFADVFGRGKADAALAAASFTSASPAPARSKKSWPAPAFREASMLIPSIDLLGGRIVQLVQGEKLRLASTTSNTGSRSFRKFPLVQLIDLDAAMRQGDNSALVAQIAKRLPVQAGGGIHTIERAPGQVLDAGAKRVIVGSALFSEQGIAVNTEFAAKLAAAMGAERASSPASTPRTAASPSKAGRRRSRSRPTMPSRSSKPMPPHFSTRTSTAKG